MLKDRALSLPQFIVIIVVAVAIILAWDFGRRILDTVQLVQASQQADTDLQSVQRTNAQLKQLKKDVTTDAWVVKKARVDMHYAQENETLFVPAATPPPRAAPAPAVPAPPPPRSFWEDWLEMIFGPTQ